MTRSAPLKRTPIARGKAPLARKVIASKPAKRPAIKTAKQWRPSAADRKFWTARRAETLERDGYRCQCLGCDMCIIPIGAVGCLCSMNLEVDHREPLRMGGSRYNAGNPLNRVENLQTLCRACHREKTEGRATVAA